MITGRFHHHRPPPSFLQPTIPLALRRLHIWISLHYPGISSGNLSRLRQSHLSQFQLRQYHRGPTQTHHPPLPQSAEFLGSRLRLRRRTDCSCNDLQRSKGTPGVYN